LTFVFAAVVAAARTGAISFALAGDLLATAGFVCAVFVATGWALAAGLLAATGFAALAGALGASVFATGFEGGLVE
jgi:hypothetical protein